MTLDEKIEEKLAGNISGFLAFPDDVGEWVMPVVREAIAEWQEECLHKTAISTKAKEAAG